jgi:hypothetical protein
MEKKRRFVRGEQRPQRAKTQQYFHSSHSVDRRPFPKNLHYQIPTNFGNKDATTWYIQFRVGDISQMKRRDLLKSNNKKKGKDQRIEHSRSVSKLDKVEYQL